MRTLISLLALSISTLFAEPFLWQDNGISLSFNHNLYYIGDSVQRGDGTFLIYWCETIDASHDIWAMYMDELGEPIWDSPRKILDSVYSLSGPQIVQINDGNLVIAALEYDAVERTMTMSKIDWNGDSLWPEPIDLENPFEYGELFFQMISDDNDGVYLVFKSVGYEYNQQSIQRISGGGEILWQPGGIDLFDGEFTLTPCQTCADGEGGIIACTIIGPYYFVAQRIMPDGSSPWDDDGVIYIGNRDNTDVMDIVPTGDGHFTTISCDTDNFNLFIQRLDIDGNLCGDPVASGGDFNTYGWNKLVSDEEGNTYFVWSSRDDGHPAIHMEKFDQDCLSCWYYSHTVTDDSGYYARPSVVFDDEGNIYQSWFYFDNYDVKMSLLKFNSEGEPLWGTEGLEISDGMDDISYTCLQYIDDNLVLVWQDQRGVISSIQRQRVTCSGALQYDDEGMVLFSCFDGYTHEYTVAEREDYAVERLYYTWWAYNDFTLNMQSIDSDGNFSVLPYGQVIHEDFSNSNQVKTMLPLQDDTIIVWTYMTSAQTQLRANRFDQNGQRQWPNDLFLDGVGQSEGSFNNVLAKQDGSKLIIAWTAHSNNVDQIKMLMLVNDEPAWDDPIDIGGTLSSNSELLCIEDEYILWEENGPRVLRIQDNGTPYPGWDTEGLLVTTVEETNSEWNAVNTEDGLAILWLMRYNGDRTIRLQVVSPDGRLRWFDGDPIIDQNQLYTPILKINSKDAYVFWRTQGKLQVQAFTLHGEPLWNEPVDISESQIKLEDVTATPDGYLIGCSYMNESDCADIFLQHIDYNGNLWSANLYPCNVPQEKADLNIIRSTNGGYFIVWSDQRNYFSYDDLYVQYLDYYATDCDESDLTPVWNPGLSVSPNPFNPETSIRFSLPVKSSVKLNVYNIRGQLVNTLCDEQMNAGDHRIEWDGRDRRQKAVSSGVYLINLNIEGKDYHHKTLLLK